MPAWEWLLGQVLATAATVGLVLFGFWRWVIRPHLDRKVAELIAATETVEARVATGVKRGAAEALRELPENALDGATVKESTRQFLKFGSGLFENGLSSFLGSAADLERKASSRPRGESPAD
jgi:hypothetical protein